MRRFLPYAVGWRAVQRSALEKCLLLGSETSAFRARHGHVCATNIVETKKICVAPKGAKRIMGWAYPRLRARALHRGLTSGRAYGARCLDLFNRRAQIQFHNKACDQRSSAKISGKFSSLPKSLVSLIIRLHAAQRHHRRHPA